MSISGQFPRRRGQESGGAELLFDEGADLAVDVLDGTIAVDDGDALGLAGGDGAVLIVDAAVEGLVLVLEAAFVLAAAAVRSLRRRARARERSKSGRSRRVRSGLSPPHMVGVHAQDDLAAELAAAALVGFGGVGVAVAEDDAARVEGGADDLRDGLGAVGEHEAELGHGGEGLGLRVEKQRRGCGRRCACRRAGG